MDAATEKKVVGLLNGPRSLTEISTFLGMDQDRTEAVLGELTRNGAVQKYGAKGGPFFSRRVALGKGKTR
jgi:hypothetical protein